MESGVRTERYMIKNTGLNSDKGNVKKEMMEGDIQRRDIRVKMGRKAKYYVGTEIKERKVEGRDKCNDINSCKKIVYINNLCVKNKKVRKKGRDSEYIYETVWRPRGK